LDGRSLQPRVEIGIARSDASAIAAGRDGLIVASQRAGVTTLQRFDRDGRERAHTALPVEHSVGRFIGVA
jgi:hypothetical protein